MIEWIISLPRNAKRLVGVTTDLALLPFVLWLAFCLRLDQLYVPEVRVATVALLTTLVTVALFVRLGLYRAVIRFAGTQLLTSVFIGISFSALALAFFGFLLQAPLPRSVPFIYFGLSVIAVGGSRLALRSLLTANTRGSQSEKVVIYGAGSAGVQLATALGQGIEYQPVAFLDDDGSKQGTILQDLHVYKPNRLQKLIERKEIGHVFLAISSLGNSERARILRFLTGYEISVKIIPSYADIAVGKANIDQLRDVEVEDLLGRDTVAPRANLLDKAITAKSVMVTGAGGSIGSELCRQICQLNPTKLVLFEISEFSLYTINEELKNSEMEVVAILGNVLDQEHLYRAMRNHRIDVVYHAAAYKHVPIVEANVLSGIKNNVLGTRHAVLAAISAGVKNFILISTDKAVRPTNVMGATKRFAEQILQAYAEGYSSEHQTLFSMVRFGNVLNSSGSVVPLFKRKIREGGPVTVTHPDVTRYFMTIPEAVQLVIQASAMSEGGDVFVLDMGKPVKIDDLAKTMIRLMGKTVNVEDRDDDGITITYTGLRPGEKLYEELLLGDNCVGTEHPMITRAIEAHLPSTDLNVQIHLIVQALDEQNQQEALRIQSTVVPEYHSGIPETENVIHFRT
ncbi:MAG: hypothetical protein CBB92_03235 [Flammeovirgaceae bacterium TMED32]|nr:MAG: hypothetical protein CBB92_03235 [Flammeovirgaceae bacterium TMED32]